MLRRSEPLSSLPVRPSGQTWKTFLYVLKHTAMDHHTSGANPTCRLANIVGSAGSVFLFFCLASFGIADRWIYRTNEGSVGTPLPEFLEFCAAADLLDCARPDPDPDQLTDAMHQAVGLLGARVLAQFPVQFPDHGLTCVLVLGESHLTVSTWPEYRMAQVDLVTCRADTGPEDALQPLVDLLGAVEVRMQRVPRVDPRAVTTAG